MDRKRIGSTKSEVQGKDDVREATGLEARDTATFQVYARERRRNLTDRELIERVLAGEDLSYEVLMARYVPGVLGYLRARLPQPADSEDLAQEVFLAAHRHLDGLRNRDRFGPWVMRIAANALADHLRRLSRRLRPVPDYCEAGSESAAERVADPSPDPAERTAERQVWQLVLEEIGRMKERYRVVLLARLLAEDTVEEIAQRLNRKPKTVQKQLLRGMQRLRTALERHGVSSMDRGVDS